MTRAERLKAAIEALTDIPIEWGVSDCSTWPAQWVADVTGREFDWPAYSSQDEAEAMIAAAGGLLPLWEAVARTAGIRRRYELLPTLGAIGIIRTHGHGDVGGVFADGGVLCWRAAWGVHLIAPRQNAVVAIWEVP